MNFSNLYIKVFIKNSSNVITNIVHILKLLDNFIFTMMNLKNFLDKEIMKC